jgi:ABC-type transporter MlaC component
MTHGAASSNDATSIACIQSEAWHRIRRAGAQKTETGAENVMRIRTLFHALFLALACLMLAGSASADESAQGFVEKQHGKISALLRQPESAARDNQVTHELDNMVDYEELARRAFGQPCPAAIPSCTNHWAELSDAQKTEVTGLLKALVEKNYRKNLIKTLDYDITFKGMKESAGDAKIRTEAKSKLKPRDPPVEVDYVVRGTNGQFHVVDIVTEGSSLTKNYYDQFHKMLTNPAQGYPHIVKKLNDKINKKD